MKFITELPPPTLSHDGNQGSWIQQYALALGFRGMDSSPTLRPIIFSYIVLQAEGSICSILTTF
jgi:hypothetical protein